MSEETSEPVAPPVEAPPVAPPVVEAAPEPSGPFVFHEDGHKVYVDVESAEPLQRQVKGLDGHLYHHVGQRVDVGGDGKTIVRWTYREEP